MGSNMAEAHPVGFQWVMEAKARGTQVVHIDPRFTRTSAVADKYVSLRVGTDIAFLGGVINYILSNELDLFYGVEFRKRFPLIELFEGKNVILNTPTGSGKSLVASVLHFQALAQGRRTITVGLPGRYLPSPPA